MAKRREQKDDKKRQEAVNQLKTLLTARTEALKAFEVNKKQAEASLTQLLTIERDIITALLTPAANQKEDP